MTGSRESKRPWLTRNLKVLSLVSLFQDTASEMLYPILPIFLTAVLGAPVAVVGMIEGVADGAASLTKIVSGRLADRRSKRGLVASGYGLAAIAKVIIAAANTWPLVLGARVLDRFGKGIRGAPRDALIADDTPPDHRGKAFGFHRSMDTAGAVFGPLIGLALYEALDHRIRPLLIVAAIPAVISVALVAFVHEPVRPTSPPPPTADDGVVESLEPLGRPYWRAVTVLGVFGIVNFSDALLILRARHVGLSVAAIIGVYCLYNFVYAALSYPAGSISDRVPRHLMIAAGLAVFAFAYLGLGIATTAVQVWILFALYGAFTALTDGVSKAWIVDLVPSSSMGRAIGLQQGIAGGGAIAAGLWAGLFWNGTGQLPLLVAGTFAALLALGLASLGHLIETTATTVAAE